jgi:phosphoribosylformylglycinamidine cyclo-ligase
MPGDDFRPHGKVPARGLTYKDAGVDIDAATGALSRIAELARSARTERVLQGIGGFGGLYSLSGLGLEDPVLVASTDGVGTKLKVAFMTGRHGTVGEDLVNHCVGDILVQGARPLFFLDYFATGGLSPEVLTSVVEGVARGCRVNGCALLGGETAEMPDFYAAGEYDLAGTIVGVVDRANLLPRKDVGAGDLLLSLDAVGLHTNGYSLARKLLFEHAGLAPEDPVPGLELSVADALLLPHPSYLPVLGGALDAGVVKALAHITGGGVPDNLPRVLPENCHGVVREGSWPVPPIFRSLQRLGGIAEEEMRRTFNMGIGMLVVVAEQDGERAESLIKAAGGSVRRVGEVAAGAGPVQYL